MLWNDIVETSSAFFMLASRFFISLRKKIAFRVFESFFLFFFLFFMLRGLNDKARKKSFRQKFFPRLSWILHVQQVFRSEGWEKYKITQFISSNFWARRKHSSRLPLILHCHLNNLSQVEKQWNEVKVFLLFFLFFPSLPPEWTANTEFHSTRVLKTTAGIFQLTVGKVSSFSSLSFNDWKLWKLHKHGKH